MGWIGGWMIAAGLSLVFMAGCTTQPPTPFKTGKEVSPPQGCIELRKRGGEC